MASGGEHTAARHDDGCIPRVAKAALALLEKHCSQRFSGIGQGLGATRRGLDRHAAKQLRGLHEAAGCWRHFTEVGEERYLEEISQALKASGTHHVQGRRKAFEPCHEPRSDETAASDHGESSAATCNSDCKDDGANKTYPAPPAHYAQFETQVTELQLKNDQLEAQLQEAVTAHETLLTLHEQEIATLTLHLNLKLAEARAQVDRGVTMVNNYFERALNKMDASDANANLSYCFDVVRSEAMKTKKQRELDAANAHIEQLGGQGQLLVALLRPTLPDDMTLYKFAQAFGSPTPTGQDFVDANHILQGDQELWRRRCWKGPSGCTPISMRAFRALYPVLE